MSVIIDIFVDVLHDSVKMFPFLFLAFAIIELTEKYTGEKRNRILACGNQAGPIIGAVFGCVPQCGFSVVAANLYSEHIISLGTLLAVFMSTSDEAILVMMGYRGSGGRIVTILLVKVVIAIVVGYLVDLFLKERIQAKHTHVNVKLTCACEKKQSSVWLEILHHTIKMLLFIFTFSFVINIVINGIGIERIREILMKDSPFQVFVSAAIGLIPNCATSLLITELYMNHILEFSSVLAGLLASGGMGLLVLWKRNQNYRENFKITMLLYIISVVVGLAFNLVGV